MSKLSVPESAQSPIAHVINSRENRFIDEILPNSIIFKTLPQGKDFNPKKILKENLNEFLVASGIQTEVSLKKTEDGKIKLNLPQNISFADVDNVKLALALSKCDGIVSSETIAKIALTCIDWAVHQNRGDLANKPHADKLTRYLPTVTSLVVPDRRAAKGQYSEEEKASAKAILTDLTRCSALLIEEINPSELKSALDAISTYTGKLVLASEKPTPLRSHHEPLPPLGTFSSVKDPTPSKPPHKVRPRPNPLPKQRRDEIGKPTHAASQEPLGGYPAEYDEATGLSAKLAKIKLDKATKDATPPKETSLKARAEDKAGWDQGKH